MKRIRVYHTKEKSVRKELEEYQKKSDKFTFELKEFTHKDAGEFGAFFCDDIKSPEYTAASMLGLSCSSIRSLYYTNFHFLSPSEVFAANLEGLRFYIKDTDKSKDILTFLIQSCGGVIVAEGLYDLEISSGKRSACYLNQENFMKINGKGKIIAMHPHDLLSSSDFLSFFFKRDEGLIQSQIIQGLPAYKENMKEESNLQERIQKVKEKYQEVDEDMDESLIKATLHCIKVDTKDITIMLSQMVQMVARGERLRAFCRNPTFTTQKTTLSTFEKYLSAIFGLNNKTLDSLIKKPPLDICWDDLWNIIKETGSIIDQSTPRTYYKYKTPVLDSKKLYSLLDVLISVVPILKPESDHMVKLFDFVMVIAAHDVHEPTSVPVYALKCRELIAIISLNVNPITLVKRFQWFLPLDVLFNLIAPRDTLIYHGVTIAEWNPEFKEILCRSFFSKFYRASLELVPMLEFRVRIFMENRTSDPKNPSVMTQSWVIGVGIICCYSLLGRSGCSELQNTLKELLPSFKCGISPQMLMFSQILNWIFINTKESEEVENNGEQDDLFLSEVDMTKEFKKLKRQ